MEIGIFARTFLPAQTGKNEGPDDSLLAGIFDRVAAHGLGQVQFNYACVGLDPLPAALPLGLPEAIRGAAGERDIGIASLSGTFNMIHPDPSRRAAGLKRLEVVVASCAALGTDLVTLCTGTRHPQNMWRWHPHNETPAAWHDLQQAMAAALAIAERFDVRLGIEPEVANVVNSAARARRLIDEMGSDRLVVVIDGANLFPAGTLPHQHAILEEAFDLLGDRIGLAHAKDLTQDGAAGNAAAGTGLLDYDHYISLLRRSGFEGALVLHGLAPEQVDGCVAFLRRALGTR